jgi:hypothetical protein
MKLNIKAFALTVGIFWGVGLFLITWWIILLDGASGETNIVSSVYRGYNISILGSLIGLAWGFIDGLIGGAIFAWLYNLISVRSKETDV